MKMIKYNSCVCLFSNKTLKFHCTFLLALNIWSLAGFANETLPMKILRSVFLHTCLVCPTWFLLKLASDSCVRRPGHWPAGCSPSRKAAWPSRPAVDPHDPSGGTWTRDRCCLQRAEENREKCWASWSRHVSRFLDITSQRYIHHVHSRQMFKEEKTRSSKTQPLYMITYNIPL